MSDKLIMRRDKLLKLIEECDRRIASEQNAYWDEAYMSNPLMDELLEDKQELMDELSEIEESIAESDTP